MKRTVLIILDGFGERAAIDGNAIRLARTPELDALLARYPHTLIETSGLAVGLPPGQMGNSEVGHMNLGSGRVVYQDLTRINKAISDGDFFQNPTLGAALDAAKAGTGRVHLIGLTSPGGVHSALHHAYALVEMCKRRGLSEVYWHAFLDGRDTPPHSALATIAEVQSELKKIGVGRLASLVGRFYAMDRDHRWDRVQAAYDLLVGGKGHVARSPVQAIEDAYARGEGDEFVTPIVLTDDAGERLPRIASGDVVVFFNFRADRARELTRAFCDDAFDGFVRASRPALARWVCLCEYDRSFGLPVAFAPQSLDMILGEYLSGLGLAQFRCAETEKYAHVTFFFNGGREAPFPLEERALIPSPREVKTYDLKPEMSARAVTDGVVAAIEKEKYGFVLCNFANPDMVGHTGVLSAGILAIDVIDECLGRIARAALQHNAVVVITADHGNCEQMIDSDGQPHTAHTTNPVPLLVLDERQLGRALRSGGRLCDVAPTVLALMGLPKPAPMEGRSLLVEPIGPADATGPVAAIED